MNADFIISLLGGIFLVPLIDWVVKRSGVTDEKAIYSLAFASSLIVGVIAAVASGKFQKGDFNTTLADFATVFTMSQTVFKLYWQNSLAREQFNQRISPTVPETVNPIAQEGESTQSIPEGQV